MARATSVHCVSLRAVSRHDIGRVCAVRFAEDDPDRPRHFRLSDRIAAGKITGGLHMAPQSRGMASIATWFPTGNV